MVCLLLLGASGKHILWHMWECEKLVMIGCFLSEDCDIRCPMDRCKDGRSGDCQLVMSSAMSQGMPRLLHAVIDSGVAV